MVHVFPRWVRETGQLCRAAGVDVTDRQIERWGRSQPGKPTGDQLGPFPGTPDTEVVEQYRVVAPLMGSGHSADEAALELARCRYPCERLRDVYIRAFCYETNALADNTEGQARFGPVPPPRSASDRAFVDDIEAQAEAAGAWLVREDSPLRPLWRALLRRVERASEVLSEEPRAIVHSLLTNGALVMAGGTMYHPRAVVSVFEDDLAEAQNVSPEVLDAFVQSCTYSIGELKQYLETVDLHQLVAFIGRLRLAEADVLQPWGLTSDEQDWPGLVATLIAPPLAMVLDRAVQLLGPALFESVVALGPLPTAQDRNSNSET
jgi:hypothetical protein